MGISFSILKKQRETSNQRSNKRAREETEDTNPTVIITQASTATVTNETVNQNRKKIQQGMFHIKIFFPNASKVNLFRRA